MTRYIVPIFAAVALSLASGTATAEDCSELSGKDAKKCEKANKKLAKARESQTPLTPSVVDASWSNWDAEDKNPFTQDAYWVGYVATDVEAVDAFLVKATSISGKLAFTRYVVDEANAGNADILAQCAPGLITALTALPDDAKALVEEGQALVGDLANILQGPDAMKIPKVTSGLTSAVGSLGSSIADAPGTLAAIVALAGDPGALLDAAAGAAMNAAGDAVGGAIGEAAGAAGDAAGAAAGAAGDAADAVKDAKEAVEDVKGE